MDISVLIVFFNRPDFLSRAFEAIRQARPARLFLYQDGPRSDRDVPGIEACRKVAEGVDWPCEVHRLYQERNFGCDPSGFISQRWAFSLTDKCIVLEDDDVPTLSFFRFCHDMLDRYADDDRIGMIQGFNQEEATTDIGQDDYFFTTNFSIWGWASWSRVVNKWDEHYSWLDDGETVSRIQSLVDERKLRKDFLPMARAHRASGKAFYETIFHAHLLLNSQLAVAPRLNLLSNLGVTNNSTHFAGSIRTMPSGLRRIFTMGRHELHFPLHHPEYVVDHVAFRRRVYRIMGWGHRWVKLWRGIEELLLNIRYGEWGRVGFALRNRLRILAFGRRFR